MPIEKIAIVVIFLLALILLQLVVKYRGRVVQASFPKANNINVNARLNLSKTERADLISVGSQDTATSSMGRSRSAPALLYLKGCQPSPQATDSGR